MDLNGRRSTGAAPKSGQRVHWRAEERQIVAAVRQPIDGEFVDVTGMSRGELVRGRPHARATAVQDHSQEPAEAAERVDERPGPSARYGAARDTIVVAGAASTSAASTSQ